MSYLGQSDAAEIVVRARTGLILDQPFFGMLALRLDLVPVATVESMSTDGRRVSYNPAWVIATDPGVVRTVLAHEVLHCALGHFARRGGRDWEIWNRATDYAVNAILVKSGFRLPTGALFDDVRFGDAAAERVYSELLQGREDGQEEPEADSGEQEQEDGASDQGGGEAGDKDGPADGSEGAGEGAGEAGGDEAGADGSGAPGGAGADGAGSGKSVGGMGNVEDAPGDGTEADREDMVREWQIATAQAAQSAKALGRLPGHLSEVVAEQRNPSMDWRVLLRRFVTERAQDDYSWARPNRRHIAAGLYLPSRHSERAGVIGVVIDTSGSVSAAELSAFATELQEIIGDVRPRETVVVHCDAMVQEVERFGPDDALAFNAKGRGGTDMAPGFAAIAEEDEPVACLICMSDMEIGMEPAEPGCPVLWLQTGTSRSATVPAYGDVVPLVL